MIHICVTSYSRSERWVIRILMRIEVIFYNTCLSPLHSSTFLFLFFKFFSSEIINIKQTCSYNYNYNVKMFSSEILRHNILGDEILGNKFYTFKQMSPWVKQDLSPYNYNYNVKIFALRLSIKLSLFGPSFMKMCEPCPSQKFFFFFTCIWK